MNCFTTLKHGHEFTDLSLSRLGLFDRADTIHALTSESDLLGIVKNNAERMP